MSFRAALSRLDRLFLFLFFPHAGVFPAVCQKLLMSAAFDDGSLVQH